MAHSIEKIILEMDKCDVLCRNCHNELTINKKRFMSFKNKIYDKINSYRELRKKIDRKKIAKMYGSGMGIIQISKAFGCTKSTISMALKKMRNQ
jgi:IS30 family transposase